MDRSPPKGGDHPATHPSSTSEGEGELSANVSAALEAGENEAPGTDQVDSFGFADEMVTQRYQTAAQMLAKAGRGRPAMVVEAISVPRTLPFTVIRRETLIGRAKECDVMLPSSAVSRRHCVVRVCKTDMMAVVVEDLGSLNGTMLDGEQLSGPKQALPGGRIEVGPFTLRLDWRSGPEILHLEEVNEQLRAAMFDPLTSLLSRQEFDRTRERDLSLRPDGEVASICILSIEDHHGTVDRFGTIAGDEIISVIAKIVQSAASEPSEAYRYSSSDFLMLLHRADPIPHVRNEVLHKIRSHNWAEVSVGLSVRVHAGVAQLDGDEPLLSAVARAQRSVALQRRGEATDLCLSPGRKGSPALERGGARNFHGNATISTSGLRRFFSVFVSYAHEDEAIAKRVFGFLEDAGVACWIDSKHMLPGDPIIETVSSRVLQWDRVVVCCSKASLRSWHVRHELAAVFEKEVDLANDGVLDWQRVIPLDLDGCIKRRDVEGVGRALRQRVVADLVGADRDNKKFNQAMRGVLSALRADESARGLPPPIAR